jgi:hypothetical protein
MFAGWSAFSDGIAGVRLEAGLDLWAQDETGQTVKEPGGRDEALDRTLQAGLFDLTGEYDFGYYTDTSDLFYTRYLNVKAGTFVVFDVWVSLEMSSLGNANSQFGGSFSVPAVYVPTFR